MNFDVFISGGYFLAKKIPRPSDLSGPVPDSIITLSDCFTDIAPDTWADAGYNYSDPERAEAASKFGIPADVVPSLVELLTQAIVPKHLCTFFPTLEIARAFHAHCLDKAVVLLLGIGLERSLMTSLRSQLKDDVNQGYGLIERVEVGKSLDPGGKVLGYEPLGYDATKFHSWLCHNAPVEAIKKFGICPNGAGFLDSFDDAVRITRNLKDTGAERAIWEPWLVVEYDYDADKRVMNAFEKSVTQKPRPAQASR